MLLNLLVDPLKLHFPFSWAPSSIQYFGIKLSNKIDNLYTAKYPPMFQKAEEKKEIIFPLKKQLWFGTSKFVVYYKASQLAQISIVYSNAPYT